MTVAAPASSAEGVVWDLSDLFAGPDDPRIDKALDALDADAGAFAATFRGTINVPGGPAPEHLLGGLTRYEDLYDRLSRAGSFASLRYAADTSSQVNRDLQQRVELRLTALHNQVLFFDLE